jgi:Protein of unknown function (DUF2550)
MVAVLLIAAAVWQGLRRTVISRRGGVIDCGLRAAAGTSWRYGVAVYERGELCWYRSPGLRLRPDARFGRAQFRIERSRQPSAGESAQLGPGLVIAECDTGAGAGLDTPNHRSRRVLPVVFARRPRPARVGRARPGAVNRHLQTADLALSEPALTGLLAWLEAAPQHPSELWLGREGGLGLSPAVG